MTSKKAYSDDPCHNSDCTTGDHIVCRFHYFPEFSNFAPLDCLSHTHIFRVVVGLQLFPLYSS